MFLTCRFEFDKAVGQALSEHRSSFRGDIGPFDIEQIEFDQSLKLNQTGIGDSGVTQVEYLELGQSFEMH